MERIIKACNKVSRVAGNKKGPLLSLPLVPSEVQAWLTWNDRDEDYQFLENSSVEEAWENLKSFWPEEDLLWWEKESASLVSKV